MLDTVMTNTMSIMSIANPLHCNTTLNLSFRMREGCHARQSCAVPWEGQLLRYGTLHNVGDSTSAFTGRCRMSHLGSN